VDEHTKSGFLPPLDAASLGFFDTVQICLRGFIGMTFQLHKYTLWVKFGGEARFFCKKADIFSEGGFFVVFGLVFVS
jgi:hypothetical protein